MDISKGEVVGHAEAAWGRAWAKGGDGGATSPPSLHSAATTKTENGMRACEKRERETERLRAGERETAGTRERERGAGVLERGVHGQFLQGAGRPFNEGKVDGSSVRKGFEVIKVNCLPL